MAFQKGVSGNKSGRPKQTPEEKEERERFKELLKSATVTALANIIQIANDKHSRDRFKANTYHEYCSRFYEYLDSSDGQAILRLFNDKYPHTGFTDAKKIDFILWVDG